MRREFKPVPGATVHDWVIDASLAAGFALATAGPYAALLLRYADTGAEQLAIEFVTALAMTAPIALRRHYPMLMLVLVSLAGLAQVAWIDRPVASIVVLPVVVYSVARWVGGRTARWAVVLGWTGSILGPMRWFLSNNPATPTLVLAALLTTVVGMGLVLTPYAMGRRLRDAAEARQAQLDGASERYRLLLAEREQEARVSEVSSRNQIARELHDILAHSLSVMIVQAEGGKAIAAKRPEAAAEVLGTIAETGREALSETRRILGLLRSETEDQLEFTPQPGLAAIPEMVRKAGARLREEGLAPSVSPTLGLTAYRLVQEALTNVMKHAGPGATAEVGITYRPNEVLIEVVDDGRGVPSPQHRRGFGLRGMAERVSAMGGKLLAEPIPEGKGFRVLAELPLKYPDAEPPAKTTGTRRPDDLATGPTLEGQLPDRSKKGWLSTPAPAPVTADPQGNSDSVTRRSPNRHPESQR